MRSLTVLLVEDNPRDVRLIQRTDRDFKRYFDACW
jgi:hypothetical protein